MARCRSCGSTVLWATTTSGRAIPVDAEPDTDWDTPIIDPAGGLRPTGWNVPGKHGPSPEVEAVGGQAELGGEGRRWRAHFETCPNADQHRRRSGDRR